MMEADFRFCKNMITLSKEAYYRFNEKCPIEACHEVEKFDILLLNNSYCH